MMIKYSSNHQNLFTMKNAGVRPSLLLYGLVTQVFVHIISLVDLHTHKIQYIICICHIGMQQQKD